jgi:hypothetical protein
MVPAKGVVVEYAGRTGEPQWKAPDKSAVWDYTVFGTQAKGAEPDGKFELNVMMMPDEGQAFNRRTVNGQGGEADRGNYQGHHQRRQKHDGRSEFHGK